MINLQAIHEEYGVQPWVFLVLYAITIAPCWIGVWMIVQAVKQRNIRALRIWAGVEVVLLILPYLYVMIAGRNLPWWVYALLGGLAVISVLEAIRAVRGRLLDPKAGSQALWNVCAFSYARAVGYSFPHLKMFAEIVQALHLKRGERILDAGCGAGDLERYLTERCPGLDVDAIDFSPSMVANARKKHAHTGARFIQADLNEPLPFPDHTFHAIISVQVFFALPRPEFTVREFARVLKPGGRLIIVDPLPESDMGKVVRAHLAEIRQLPGRHRVLAYIDFLRRIPHGVVVLALNVIMGFWAKEGAYHFHTAQELESYFSKHGMVMQMVQPSLAEQDVMVVAQRDDATPVWNDQAPSSPQLA